MGTHALRHPGVVGAPVPRWAAVAGWASLVLPLPSILWRMAMLAGIDVGFRDAASYRDSADAAIYVMGLEAVQLLVALLCFGLIRPWGEVLPHWLPAAGGRTIHRLIPTAAGTAGAIALWTILLPLAAALTRRWMGITDGWTPDIGMSDGERVLLLIAYVPFFLWPAAVSAAIVGYWARRSPRSASLTGPTRTTEPARRPSSAPG